MHQHRRYYKNLYYLNKIIVLRYVLIYLFCFQIYILKYLQINKKDSKKYLFCTVIEIFIVIITAYYLYKMYNVFIKHYNITLDFFKWS